MGLVAALGCSAAQPRARAALTTSLPCLARGASPVAFGTISIDEETKDASGVQFSFQYVADSLAGWVRDARGEVPRAKHLRELTFDAAADTVSFWYASNGTRYIFRLRMTCEELSGTSRLFVTERDSGIVVEQTLMRSRPITFP